MVGTTEVSYQGNPADTEPTKAEHDYLLAVYRHYFEGDATVIESFAGLRVLPKTGHHYFHRPRDTILYQAADNRALLSLYGGKLTGYRATAQQVMEKILPLLPAKKARADTARLSLRPVEGNLC